MKNTQKILVGGVPFGRDNVGDEAILECIVSIIRNALPNTEIWVSTDDPEATELKLGVKSVPLFGFDPPGFNADEMLRIIDAADAFVWAGATGLSDYPEVPLRLLQLAADRGKKTVIFCTGMNTQLNPFLYNLQAGPRHKVFSLIRGLSFGSIDLIKRYEAQGRQRVAAKMKKGVESAGLVVLRDAQSLDAMRSLIGEPCVPVMIGADPAIEILPKSLESSRFSSDVKAYCRKQNRKIGLCISAQSPVQKLQDLALLFDRLIADFQLDIIGIPMNPVTDSRLLNDFRRLLKQPEAMCVATGRFEPDEIAGLAAEMDVVISSRLHLLILASITSTPFIGISRGSKISNFCRQFQLPEIGSVDNLNLDSLESEIMRLLNERVQFEKIAEAVQADMLMQLELAKVSLSSFLS